MIKQIEKRLTDKRAKKQEPQRSGEPLGLSEMMGFCQPCENPDCKDKNGGKVGLSSACHSPGGIKLTAGSGVIDMHCRACGQLFLSCYAEAVDLLPQTCHPRGGCDVSITRKTGYLTVRCHLCFASLGGAAVTEAPEEAGTMYGSAAASTDGWNESLIDLIRVCPAARLNRVMTEKSSRSTRMSRRDTRAAVTVPLEHGGFLNLSAEGRLVTLVVEDVGFSGFTTSFERGDFKKGLQEGGLWEWPGIGWLVASSPGQGQARLCMVPAHGAGNVTTRQISASKGSVSSGFSFTANLSLAEVMERL